MEISYEIPEIETVVMGGHNAGLSNRMRELGSELPALNAKDAAKYDFSKCKSLEEVRDMLQEMVNLDYHLVGTRDYVYNSRGMLSELHSVIKRVEDTPEGEPVSYLWNLFTRTNGLRDSIMQIILNMGKEDDEN